MPFPFPGRRRVWLTFSVAMALASAVPATAAAGEFVITACDAAADHSTNGWRAETSQGMTTGGDCPTSGNPGAGLFARTLRLDGQRVPQGTAARTIFDAPPGTAIVGLNGSYTFTREDGGWQVGLSNGAKLIAGCPPGSGGCSVGGDGNLPIPGSQRLYLEALCTAASCSVGSSGAKGGWQANAQLYASAMRLQDDSAPTVQLTGGSVLEDRWLSGDVTVRFDAIDNAGVPSAVAQIDGSEKSVGTECLSSTYICGNTTIQVKLSTRGVVADGVRTLQVRASDRAGNRSAAQRTVRVDNSPPTQPLDLQVTGGAAWRAKNSFALSWRNPTAEGAPVAAAVFELCPAGVTSGTAACVRGARDKPGIESIDDLELPGRGEWALRLWLRDEAGNEDKALAAQPLMLGYDDDAPSLAVSRLNVDDPTRLGVRASDQTSGIERGEVELRRVGDSAWRPLSTSLTAEGFTGLIDDETLPDGTYEIRARAVDRAENERTSTVFDDGQPAQVGLPIRIKTRLVAGRNRQVRLKKRRGTRRYRTVLVSRPRLRYGRSAQLQGRLTTPGANAVGGAPIEISERVDLAGAPYRPLGRVTTSKTGRFTFKVGKGPKRFLRFRYPGTAKVRPETFEVTLKVKASSSLRPSRRSVVNGEDVVFRGRLKGRPLPPTSKLVQLQAFSRGRWLTFATPRANPTTGLWTYRYRFAATRGRVRYRFRARVPREASYPYDTGGSPTVRVAVRGL